MASPYKMKNSMLKMAVKGAPMQKNYAGSAFKSDKDKIKITDPVPTAGDTLGAYAYQNYPSLRSHPEGGPKIKASNDKLKGHRVTKEEMLKSSKSYTKNPQ